MHWHRRGNAAVTALSLTALLGFGALAVDAAYIRVVNSQLQSAIDAAALAAAGRLDGTDEGINAAFAVADEITPLNPVVGGYTLSPDEIAFGRWTKEGGFVAGVDVENVNAVRIDTKQKGLNAILAGAAFGQDVLHTSASTLAVVPEGGPASEVECYLPIAMSDCDFAGGNPTSNPAPIPLYLSNDSNDNVGWAHPDGSNVDAVRDLLHGNCDGGLGLGEPMPLINGVGNRVIQDIEELLNGDRDGNVSEWPSETFPAGPPDRNGDHAFADSSVEEVMWGNVIGGPIALVDTGNCNDPKFNQDPVITGFTYGFIYDVVNQGNNQSLMLQLDLVNEYSIGEDHDPDAHGNVIDKFGPPRFVGL